MKIHFSKIYLIVIMVIHAFSISSCQQSEKITLLSKYDFKDKDNIDFKLDKSLNEISGLCDAGNNFVFAHNDEEAIISKIDLSSGKVVIQFFLGKGIIKEDFEGIAVAGGYAYLITSDGVLYKFRAGENNQFVEYEAIKTGLKKGNNIEGLCYDSLSNSLLLACKDVTKKNYKHYRTVYEFDLKENRLKDAPRFLISLKELNKRFDISDFAPSGIEQHPLNGNFFIISANEPSIIEISPTGKLIDAVKLKDKEHRQTEGITILGDNRIILSDEADNKKAKLTIIKIQ